MAHATARSRSPRVRRRRKKAELPVNAAADRNVAKMAAAVAGSLSVLRAGVNREALRIALERNSPEMAIDAFAWDRWARAFEAVVLPRIGKTMEDAANAAGAKTVIQKQEGVEKIRLTLKGIFDLLNPRAQRWAAQFAARFVTRVEENTRHAMRQVIADAQAQGTGLRAQADQLAKILTDTAGLDGPRARALAQYQSRLWDSGLNVNVIDQRVQQMRDRLLMDRAKLIARHETQDAANAGQAELWNQAEEQGLLPRGWLQEWIVAPPVRRNRVCPICQGMAGQRVPRGQLFVSEYDGSTHERPPAHIQCRCALGLVDPDEVQKYDPNQPRDGQGQWTDTGGGLASSRLTSGG